MKEAPMTYTLLFVCPHGAAKSVIAAALCQQFADARGMDLSARAAGTEPDPQVSPTAVALLRAEGIDVATTIPHQVTADELVAASYVISLGCDLTHLISPVTPVEQWEDVTPVSENPTLARDQIRAHVERFMETLHGHVQE